MMSPRAKSVDLAIQLMREPGQRLPGLGIGRGKGPNKAGAREAGLDLGTIGHVNIVVIIHKVMAGYLSIDDQTKAGEDCPQSHLH